ncbi:DNA repair helicase rad3/xp-D, putative [Entamoeba invadens IP1]|uniref:DNA 5'-3' helicase n=1 Tax=Entamoeba invadens IP1 TaxID=370355 RepID=A0A0A1U1X5_ENTIV|nr:DNA repair helicase rad3/xp-D, putative [Entamoeba invadens IP1]ELP88051.1 DNA repair helicase rad3/xp-D, putative [Entamoeba invadens IP1]|eukprot:XP_004254822.1 DNA repair helicase rad3/xp-D, putative [Entamoeba invadens IP1]
MSEEINFTITGVPIHFPYKYIYPEQYSFIKTVVSGVTSKTPPHKQIVIEMGTGTGKTVSIITAGKGLLGTTGSNVDHVIYCTRTVDEMRQIFKELKVLNIPAVALASRKHMCLLEDVRDSPHASVLCKERRESGFCQYYQDIEDINIPPIAGVDDLVEFGKKNRRCPYYCSRRNFFKSPFIVCTYNYLVDPKVENVTIGKMSDLHRTLLVFDEAHNIDNAFVDAQTMSLSLETIELATVSLTRLSKLLTAEKSKESLEMEYNRLVEGLRRSQAIYEDGEPYFYNETKKNEAGEDVPYDKVLPGSFRNSSQFVAILKRVVNFFRERLHEAQSKKDQRLKGQHTAQVKDIVTLLCDVLVIPPEIIKSLPTRLRVLIKTLGDEGGERKDVTGDHFYYDALYLVADFAALLCIGQEGFSYVPDVVKNDEDNEVHPILYLVCVDAANAAQNVLTKMHTTLFTSGTLAPLDTFIKLLGMNNVVEKKQIVSPVCGVGRRICPLFVTKGFDRIAVSSQLADAKMSQLRGDGFSTQFPFRADRLILHSYGKLIVELSKIVPDGILCFFPSYVYMNLCISHWDEMDVIGNILLNKLLFIESKNAEETSIAFQNYRLACHSGKGAVMLAVARGRLSEGIDFADHLARAVVIIGAPYQQTSPIPIQERLNYLDKKKVIAKEDYFVFDAMRAANQCVGRCLRGKMDYAVVIYADKRYKFNDAKILNTMPQWIIDALMKQNADLSADQSVVIAKDFLMKMSFSFDSDFPLEDMVGKTLWTEKDVLNEQMKQQ